MRRLKCPRCSQIVEVPDGASPRCSSCGFGGPARQPAPQPARAPPSPAPPPPYGASPYPAYGAPPKRSTGKTVGITLGIVAGALVLLIVAASVIFVLVSNLSDGPEADCRAGETHFQQRSYAMCGPAGWDRINFPIVDVIFMSADTGDGYMENLNVVTQRRDPTQTLDQAFAQAKEETALVITDYTLVDEGRTTVDGRDAHWIEYTGREGQIDIHAWALLVFSDDHVHVVNYFADMDDYAAQYPRLQRAVQSMVF